MSEFSFIARATDSLGRIAASPQVVPVGTMSSLLHFDGADGSSTFTDETGKAWTAVGNAQIDTAQSKFGGAAGLFDGSGDYIRTPAHADFNFGTGDFTIEGFVRQTGAAANKIILDNRFTDLDSGYAIYVNASGLLALWTGGAIRLVGGAGHTVPSNAWQHFAYTRRAGILNVFQDGVLAASAAYAGAMGCPSQVRVGSQFSSTNYFNGHIDEMRIVKAAAMYVNSFTPPTAPFPNP